MNIEGDPQQHYLPRMEGAGLTSSFQQLDRKQQEKQTDLLQYYWWKQPYFLGRKWWGPGLTFNPADIFGEPGRMELDKQRPGIYLISEKDGWRHIYKISRDGKTVTLLANGACGYRWDQSHYEKNNCLFYSITKQCKPQLYLYRQSFDGSLGKKGYRCRNDKWCRIAGYHEYNISPTAKAAMHSFSNHNTLPGEKNDYVREEQTT